ncbi:MAG TPA: hypothetical protein VGB77_06575 [Abditibacteriaceae bacterium]|jgi:hypothetical protein
MVENSPKSLIITGPNAQTNLTAPAPELAKPEERLLVPGYVNEMRQRVVQGMAASVGIPSTVPAHAKAVDEVPIVLVGVQETKTGAPGKTVSTRAKELKKTQGCRTWNRKRRRDEAKKKHSSILDR